MTKTIRQDYYSIAETATELGVSKTSVYKKLSNYKDFYSKYIKREKNITYISTKGLEALKTNAHKQEVKPIQPKPKVEKVEKVESKDKRIQELEAKVESLTKELLETKDKLLEEKDRQINSLIELHIKRNQLEEKNQPDIKENQDSTDKDNKPGFIKRIGLFFKGN